MIEEENQQEFVKPIIKYTTRYCDFSDASYSTIRDICYQVFADAQKLKMDKKDAKGKK